MNISSSNDTLAINNIKEAIHNLCKIKHVRPTTEKIYHYLKKENNNLEMADFKRDFDYLVDSDQIEIKGDGESESVGITKHYDKYNSSFNDDLITRSLIENSKLTESGKEPSNELSNGRDITDPKKYIDKMTSKKGSMLMEESSILYERLIQSLNSKFFFLKEQIVSKDHYYNEEIMFLRKQLDFSNSKYVPVEATVKSDGKNKKIKKIENSQCTNDKEINIAFDIKMK